MLGFSKTKPIIDEKRIDELLSRGIENVFPSRDFVKSKMMRGERVTLYLGIDPTGPTLHMGHVIPLLRLAEFQKLGHQIILLMGDFTAMIGDPTDKSATRRKLTKKEVLSNLAQYKKQASKFISFSGSNKALFKYNAKWLSPMTFADVLELTSLVTVDQMLKRDMFVQRAKEGKPVYIHEFLYPLMQGYDSIAMDVDGEIGGNDQMFNMLMGRDLLKIIKNKEKFVITTKLLVDSSGKKMGKTENNMISLDQTADDMFGKVMSWTDDMIIPAFELVTQTPTSHISKIHAEINSGANPRDSKIELASEIVSLYHGKQSAEKAKNNFDNTFAGKGVPENIQEIIVPEGTKLMDVVVQMSGAVSSNTEWRRLVLDNAISNVDTDSKVTNPDVVAEDGVYKIGKRRFVKITHK